MKWFDLLLYVLLVIVLALVLAAGSGCQHWVYTDPAGHRISVTRFATSADFGTLVLKHPDGAELHLYDTRSQSQDAGPILGQAIRAAMGLPPLP